MSKKNFTTESAENTEENQSVNIQIDIYLFVVSVRSVVNTIFLILLPQFRAVDRVAAELLFDAQ